MDFSDLRESDPPEMSLTLKFLLENPSLLQPPDTLENEGTCKEDKSCDQNQQNDLTSAYLGPQIWSDMLLSDDLKLEPVDLDELLDPTGIEDEVGDLGLIMSASPQHPPLTGELKPSTGDPTLVNYQDIPALMNLHSPEEKNASSPSQYFNGISKSPCQGSDSLKPVVPHVISHPLNQQCKLQPSPIHGHAQKMTEQQLCDQQFAIFSDIMTNNRFELNQPTTATQQSSGNSAKRLRLSSQPSKPTIPQSTVIASPIIPTTLQRQHSSIDPVFTPPAPQQVPIPNILPTVVEKEENCQIPPISSIEVRIPSPKCVNYVPNTSDVIISTPHTEEGEEATFDPSTRAFTEEELKPQPIIRKSKKVYVDADSKDGRYWSRRTKNNVAAKRSREARRIKENQIAMRANYLEQENATLKSEVSELRNELTRVMELVRNYESRFPQIRQ